MKSISLPYRKRTFIFSGSMFKYEHRIEQLASQVLHPRFDVVVVINSKLEEQSQLLTTVAKRLDHLSYNVKIWEPRHT